MTGIIKFFQEGGVFMYPIAVVLAVGLAIAVERYLYIRTTRASNRRIWSTVQPLLKHGEIDAALTQASESNTAIGKILTYGLTRSSTTRRSADVELAMEEGLMEVLPRLERRSHYLATFANLATLLGLLGTIIGLIHAFTAVAGANPADKADLLSASISVAMNTTAFGLIAGIPLLFLHSLIQSKTSEVVDSLEMVSVRILNLITQRMSGATES
ncbi:MAG: MotA/TolQ/ExbB proton channel family protein [bacterium]